MKTFLSYSTNSILASNISYTMDITEAFRSEDLSKADFFDFVITPDAIDPNHLQFKPVRTTVNALLSGGNNNNNTLIMNNNNNENSKETNNNLLSNVDLQPVVTTSAADSVTSFDATFWGDKETVRIETAILEDLNKYCWSTEDEAVVKNNNNNNTDGHIYTLTVLNGVDQNATWYRQPNIKEEESISSPSSMEHLQTGLDIDSILNIMPGQLNGFSTAYTDSGTMSPNTDGLIKSETYTYEDSGFADNKDELATSLIIDTPLLEAHDSFNNNNDWKLTNNNNSTTTTTISNSVATSEGSSASITSNNNTVADSLLRSALQGKTFVRYNGTSKTKTSSEANTELRRVLSTPPTKNETIFVKEETDSNMIPTIVATGIDANGTIIFEERITSTPRQTDSDNPSSVHSMDDILLSQLDSTFPDDYEKLKRIANEVAESVNQFCHIDTGGLETTTVYSINREPVITMNDLTSPITITPVVTSTKPASKKYKRSNSTGGKSATSTAGAAGGQNATTNASAATSTSGGGGSTPGSASSSNGVRKERSLHYCSICSKGFKDKYSVNVHIRTHTGEKPFACSLCGKSFRQKAHLAKHYQTHVAQKNAAAAGTVAVTKTKSR